jgi:hypothetical protein
MFTTGSKFFLGGTTLAAVAATVMAITSGGQVGWTGTTGLLFAFIAFALLAGMNYFTRDGNVSGVQQGGGAGSAADQGPLGASVWPAVMALGGGMLVVGADTYPVVFKIGVIVVLAAGFEWLVHAWSDRASDSADYNRSIRQRFLHPIEFPVAAAAGAGILVYSFSRIMLWASKEAGPILFVAAGAAVLVAGFLIAARPTMRKGVVAGVGALAALGVVGTGAVMAVDGQRKISNYPVTSNEEYREICELPGEVEVIDEHTEHLAEIDEKAASNVSMLSNIAIIVSLEGESLTAEPIGRGPTNEVFIARSNPTNVRFVNNSDEPRRFTVELGQFPRQDDPETLEQFVVCTPLIEPDGEGFLTLRFPKTSAQSGTPYAIHVPGVEGQEIEVLVP